MPDVTSDTADLATRNTSTTSWSDAQGSETTTGTSSNAGATVNNFGIYNIFTAGRTGTNTFTINRSYFPFDLSGLGLSAGEGIVSATLTLHAQIITGTGGHTTGTAAHDKIYLRGAGPLDNGAADYGNVYSSGTTKFASFGSGTASTTAGNVVITLNSDGLSFLTGFMGQAGASGTATIAALGFLDDQDTAPGLIGGGSDSSVKIALTYSNNASNKPTLSITTGAVSTTATTYNNIGDEQVIKTNTIVIKAGLLKF